MGRWSPEHGKPKRHVLVEVSTAGAAPGEAYDYWRNIAYYHFDADPRPPGGAEQFRARAQALVTPRGDLYLYHSSAVCGRRTARQVRADAGDGFSFGMVLSGFRRHRDETDGVTLAGPGAFFCYDTTRVSRVAWDDHSGLHLVFPRELVCATIGGPIPPVSQLIEKLGRSRLAPFLRSHYAVLAREFPSLSLPEQAAIYEATVDLTLSVLRQALASQSTPSPADSHAYVAAAKRLIHERFADPNLTPEIVARALRCSRATLYRAFGAYGMTVAQYIREVRLQEAMRRIAASPPGTCIATVAAECGFFGPAYFRRLFRERFGVNPSEVLGAHWAGADHTRKELSQTSPGETEFTLP